MDFTQFQKSTVRIYRTLVLIILLGGLGCATMPIPQVSKYSFPAQFAFIDEPGRPYEILGQVRSKAVWQTLDPEHEEKMLCQNYYNKAVNDLVKRAQQKGADAVIQVQSVVFMLDGKQEAHSTPECSDDGAEGQVLVQGLAIKWKVPKKTELLR